MYTQIYIYMINIIISPKNEKLNSNVLVNQYSTVQTVGPRGGFFTLPARRPGRLRNAQLTRSALSCGGDGITL